MRVKAGAADPTAQSLWAITAYFNPAGYRRKLANYRLFRERLMVPLVAIELAYGPEFELNENDAEILVRLNGRDIMWQRERLLNVALRSLPSHCKNVISVDCDLLFEDDDWPERLSRSLQHSMILQPFSRVHSLPRNWAGGQIRPAAECHPSITSAIASGVPASLCIGEPILQDGGYSYARGFAWAARRELLDRHGFYDGCIIGNGDRAMAGAIYGCYEEVMRFQCMSDRQRARYLAWAEPFHDAVGGAAGSMPGIIHHLWHGDMRDRRYQERHKILPRFVFDPFEDIAIDESGCWRWNSHKPEMHASVREYFYSRNEDG